VSMGEEGTWYLEDQRMVTFVHSSCSNAPSVSFLDISPGAPGERKDQVLLSLSLLGEMGRGTRARGGFNSSSCLVALLVVLPASWDSGVARGRHRSRCPRP
jgi:hypothetical protein